MVFVIGWSSSSVSNIPLMTKDGFKIPQPNHELIFPEAHGSHPEYAIEWWYLTGHLFANGKRFGYQATFFRNADRPMKGDGEGQYLDNTFFLGHMALTDVAGLGFGHQEKLARGSWDAYAKTGKCDVRIENWTFSQPDLAREVFELSFSIGSHTTVELKLTPAKSLIRFGKDGTSRKGAEPSARSFYLTFPRMNTTGEIRRGDNMIQVTGESWMDHEIASRQLSEDLEGWDWTAIQFHDGWEMKAYILRKPGGEADDFSRLYWISPEGDVVESLTKEFTWDRTEWWTSPKTNVTYPIGVRITTVDPRTGEQRTFTLEPVMEAQELYTSSAGFPYWEGAGDVVDDSGEQVGYSYLELVGYGGLSGGLK